MKVDDFNIWWKHDIDNKSTLCIISKEEEVLAEGRATAYATTSFNKVVGRKESLKKALYDSDWDSTKEERTHIWEGVLSETHLIPSQKIKEKNERRIINAVLHQLEEQGFLVDYEQLNYEEIL